MKIIPGIITAFVIALLILAGPANAFIIGLNGFSISNPEKGQEISTTATIEINSNERMPLPNPAGVFIDGESKCNFEVNADETNCTGVNVKLISDTTSYGQGYGFGYGYGYGYGYHNGFSNGIFTYNITINTDYFSVGEHTIQLRVNARSDEIQRMYYSDKQIITIGLAAEQEHATNETTTISQNTTEIVIDAGSGNVTEIIIPSDISSDTEILLNLVALLTEGNVTINNNLSLTREGAYNYTAEIENGTVISGGDGWDGNMILPTIQSNSDYSISGGTVDVVVNMGSDIELNFSKAVKVIIGGMAGKKAGWSRGAGALNEITTACNADHSNINANDPRECYIDEGADLVIWTYHFTEFAAYSPSSGVVASSSGSSSGVSGGCKTTWECTEWSSCINDTQIRTCSKAKPVCYADPALKPVESQSCATAPATPTEGAGEEGVIGRPAGILGAVIGALGPVGFTAISIFLIAIIGLAIILPLRKIRLAKKQ